ncbi:MAG: TetR/AcrR family transcriptional regulator [Haliscomenobacter sp.]|nr:TetR/AcrR family transcriptional regulator [Haliscomenobacter sp.]MBV6426218.1 Nucleoid occlusion factor SlmA [Haliscomenobacter sp.]
MQASLISDRQFEIIQATGKILSSAGVSGLTIKNLAKEMGFAESAIYRHFDSKEAIIIAMLDFLAENMEERLGRVLSHQKNPREALEAIFNDQFAYFAKNPHFVVAVFSDGLMEASQKINTAIFRIMQVNMKHLMPVIMEGQHQGYFTNAIPTEELMHIIMGAFRLQMFKWRVANFQFDIFERGKYLMSNILKIILA